MAGINKGALKLTDRTNLLRLAKYLGLKCTEGMSHKQLWKLIWWRVRDRGVDR